ncbi:MAG TPA: permease [Kofleriaceae bacterium]|nr:permease [Kofleriaceae bacterium]
MMDVNTWILLGLTLIALVVAYARRPGLAGDGLLAGGRLLRGVAPELVLGFALAGLVDVLIPSATLVRWLGAESSGRGILIGWLVGLVIPGGPYVFFPIAAALFRQGAAPAALLTLIAAKTLVSPIRMLTYEAPVLGWPLTLARLIPGMLVPPLVGWLGGVLYKLFAQRP